MFKIFKAESTEFFVTGTTSVNLFSFGTSWVWCAHRWVGVVRQWWVAVFESLEVLRSEIETQRPWPFLCSLGRMLKVR